MAVGEFNHKRRFSKDFLMLGQQMSDPPSYGVDMRTPPHIRDEQQLNEIDGYLELGMEDEALELI